MWQIFVFPFGAGAAIFIVLYGTCFWRLGRGPFDMDPGAEPGGFEEHLKRYQNLFQLLITLATATVAFLVHFLISISPDQRRGVYSIRLEGACPSTIAVLGLSVIFALLFIIFENLAYEEYSDYLRTTRKNARSGRNNPYTRAWYATNLAFGYTSLVLFLLGYGFLAYLLFRG